MAESTNDRSQGAAGDGEGEWDNVVKRISQRIKRKSGGAPTTQSGLDLASELVRLERRAREAETRLQGERDAYAVRVREMEEKLRKLEPWLRQLKDEYRKATEERDRLRAVASAAESGLPLTAENSLAASERDAAQKDAMTARVARDAAVTEATQSRARLDAQKSALADVGANEQRIAAAEKARDQALADAAKMKTAAVEQRRAEDEVRRLLKQIEQLETTTSAHKAVARAAQEAAETLQAKLSETEKSAQKNAGSAQQDGQRADTLARELETARADLAAAKAQAAESERTAVAIRGGEEGVRRELADKAGALAAALSGADESRRAAARLKDDVADAHREIERARAESARARSELEALRRETDSATADAAKTTTALETAEADARAARDEAAASRRQAAESKELCEIAMRSEAETRKLAEETSARLVASEAAKAGLETRAARAESRVAELESEIELVKNRSQTLSIEAADLGRTIEQERQGATKRFEAAETSWRSQMRAAESRFEGEIHREREAAGEAERALQLLEDRVRRASAEHDEAIARVRAEAMHFVAVKAQEIVVGMQRIVGEEPVTVPPITSAMDSDAQLHTPTATVLVPPPITGEWDRLMSDVEQLRTEVEEMKDEDVSATRQDTDSLTEDDMTALANAANAGTVPELAPEPELVLEEPVPVAAPIRSTAPPTVAMDAQSVEQLTEKARRAKRRR